MALTDRREWRSILLSAMAIVALGGTLWTVADLTGIVLAAVVGLTWVAVPTVYTFAVGELLYTVLLAGSVEQPLLGVAAFGVLFIADIARLWSGATALVAGLVFALSGVAFGGTQLVDSMYVGATALLLGFAVTAYSLHRYELVRLGLVTEEQT